MSANSPEEVPTGRFQVKVTSDSHFGWIRTRLAIDRTLMAWVRTAVSLIGFGFTIVQFFQHLNDMSGVAAARRPQAPRYLGLALIGAGVMVMLISAYQYRRGVRYLWSDQYRVLAGIDASGKMPRIIEQSPGLAVTLLVLLIGLFAFSAVALRFV